MLLREAIDAAILHHMVVRPYGNQWQVAFRYDKTIEPRITDTLEEAVDLMPVMRKEREEKQAGDKSFF